MGPGNEAKPFPNSKYALIGNTLVSEISLVPKCGGGGGERVPGTHCLCMCVIIGQATWQN